MPALAALLRALVVWLLFIATESVAGVLRRVLLSPEVVAAARQGSVIVGILILLAITWACSRWMRIPNARAALAIGLVWVILTLSFEIGLGRAMGLSWSRIGSDYDLRHGGLMPLGLLAMALTPWAVRLLGAHRDRGRRQAT